MRKRIAFILLALALLCLCPAFASADGSGQCGEDLYWSFDESTATLTFTGSGEMYDYGNVRNIPWFPFREQVEHVVLSEGITKIGYAAFAHCILLTQIELPDSLRIIGEAAFAGAGLTSITIPDKVETILADAFSTCEGLTSIVLPDSVTSIGRQVFDACTTLSSITIGNGIKTVPEYAFINCSALESIVVPDTVETLETGAFCFSGLKTITLPSGLTCIPSCCFSECYKLSSITIPDGVTDIGGTAFSYCTTLTRITIGKGVTNIASDAFEKCTALSDVYYRGTEEQRAQIQINNSNGSNDPLLYAAWHYSFDSFTGVVTYRDGRNVYLQNGETARLVLLDSSNSQANMNAVQKGRVVTVTGEVMTYQQGEYKIPEIMDAMIVEVADTNTAVAPTAAAIEDLGDGLMARLVRVKTTKAALAAANLQLDLNGYLDEQTLTVTGVLSANSSGRILLGTDIQAEHVPGNPVQENETAATCTAAGSYDEVVYCAACGAELSREEKSIPALGHVEGEPVQENLIPPTVTAEGGYDRVVYCTRCHGELQREHVVLDRLSMAPPTITADPKSANVKSGSKATLSVKAKGKDLHYQWYSRGDEQHDWAAIAGATKSSYAVTGSKGNMGWLYRCGVSNEGGTVYSDAATLHVTLQPPVVKTQPKNQAVLSGKTVKFTVKASGKGLTYQWFERPSAQAEWAPVPAGTKATLSLMAIGAMNGSEYYCHVENADGWADSDPAALAVAPQPASVKTQPKDATVKSGAKAKFTVKGAGPNLRYQWFEQAAGSDGWIEIEGATKAEYSFTVSYDNNGRRYYCHVYNDDGFADSGEVTLTVTPVAPKFSAQPRDAKVKAGTEARFKVKASGANVTYQWYYRISADGEWILMDGETDAILTVLTAEGNFGWQFRCTAAADGLTVDSKIATLKKK